MNIFKKIYLASRKLEKQFTPLNWIEVSQKAILHNYDYIASLHPNTYILPVLKSNAYGHGLRQVATILKKRIFPYLVVDGYFEALHIREVTNQAVLIMGYIQSDNFAYMKFDNFAFVVHDVQTIQALGKTKKRIPIHIEINTGMNRYGVQIDMLQHILEEIKKYPDLIFEGVMSHLADADNSDNTYSKIQEQLFAEALQIIHDARYNPRYIHLAQTAGSTKITDKECNAIRLGIGLYGINPLSDIDTKFSTLTKLKPALKLSSTISKIIDLKEGDKVSYNGTFTTEQPMRIGILPLGYYEGIPRALSNSGVVKYQENTYLSIVGRICMNHSMIDIGHNTSLQAGSSVTIISANTHDTNSITGIAKTHNLFSYELLVRLNPTIRRIIV